MKKKLSEEEIEYINSLDDEVSLLNIPLGYDLMFDEKLGIILKKNKHSSKRNKLFHVAG